MANLTRTTQDHDEIRRWAEQRGGKPAHVKRTGSAEDIGILRIDFPGFGGTDTLEEIGWEQWFNKFGERNLALIYQEETAGGARSNFNKIVSAETAEEAEEKSQGSAGAKSKSAGRKSAAKKSKKAAPAKSKKAAARKAGGASKKSAKRAGTRVAAKKSGAKAVKKAAKKSASRGKRGAKKAAGKKRR